MIRDFLILIFKDALRSESGLKLFELILLGRRHWVLRVYFEFCQLPELRIVKIAPSRDAGQAKEG